MDIPTIVATAKPILKKHGIKRAALFGSIVRGRASAKSDIDMLIEAPPSMSLFDMAGLSVDLEEALRHPVDLVEYDALRPMIKGAILKHEYPFL